MGAMDREVPVVPVVQVVVATAMTDVVEVVAGAGEVSNGASSTG